MKKPSAVIVNLQESWLPGNHWVAVYLPKFGPAYYFDSFGMERPKEVQIFMERNSRHWIHKTKIYQGELSNLCGYYCILFISCLPDMEKMKSIIYPCEYFNNDISIIKYIKNNL